MRELSGTLLAAQQAASAQPYVKVQVMGKVGGVSRLCWEPLYQGTEADYYHAATMPGDGSLVRLRVALEGNQLYRQRVASPGPGAAFSAWTEMSQAAHAVALCSQGAEVLAFYVGGDGRLYRQESTDYGESFAAPIDMGVVPGTEGRLGAAFGQGGQVALFYSQGGVIYVMERSGGQWGAPAAWTESAAAITGIGVYYEGDWNLIVSGADDAGNRWVWGCIRGGGYTVAPGSWAPLSPLAFASAGSGVEFHFPSLSFPDVFRHFFIERYSGTEAYSRPFWCHAIASADFISARWREAVPFDASSQYGVALTYHGPYAWLSAPFAVWRAAISPPLVEVTEDVVEAMAWSRPSSGGLKLVLRNDDGRYAEPGSGALEAIQAGSQVRLSLGYVTAAGAEVSPGPYYWIEGWEHICHRDQSLLVLHGHDGWQLLDRWRARRQFRWAKGESCVGEILIFIFAHAGLELEFTTKSDALSEHHPAFTIHPGESGATAVRRLLEMVSDRLYFAGSGGRTKDPTADEASTYSYGAGHAIIEGRYTSSAQGINRVQVFGDGICSERFHWPEVEKVYDRLRQVHDANLDTATRAQERGDAELKGEEIAAQGGELVVPVNCGQELYDVVEVSDGRAGLAQARRRVVAMTLHYSTRGQPRYQHRLGLGGV